MLFDAQVQGRLIPATSENTMYMQAAPGVDWNRSIGMFPLFNDRVYLTLLIALL